MAIIEIIDKDVGTVNKPAPPLHNRVAPQLAQDGNICPRCGKGSAPTAAFCVSCGTALTAPQGLACTKCGAVSSLASAKFCMKCGVPFAPAATGPQPVKCPCCSADLPITRDRYEALTGSDIHCFKCNKTFAIPFAEATHGHDQGHGRV